MLIAYVAVGFLIGLFLFLVSDRDTVEQTVFKTAMGAWTLWSAAMLLGMVAQYMQQSGSTMRLF